MSVSGHVPEQACSEQRRDGEDERNDALCERRRVEESQEENGEELAQVVDHCDDAVEDEEARRFRVQTATPANNNVRTLPKYSRRLTCKQ